MHDAHHHLKLVMAEVPYAEVGDDSILSHRTAAEAEWAGPCIAHAWDRTDSYVVTDVPALGYCSIGMHSSL